MVTIKLFIQHVICDLKIFLRVTIKETDLHKFKFKFFIALSFTTYQHYTIYSIIIISQPSLYCSIASYTALNIILLVLRSFIQYLKKPT